MPMNHRDSVMTTEPSGKNPTQNMTTITKTFLAAAVVGFSIGSIVDFSNLTTDPEWTVAMPLGAVFFGLFLISLMLEREMAAFDQEEAKRLEVLLHETAAPKTRPKTSVNQGIALLKERVQ
jgi:hypothetical protein